MSTPNSKPTRQQLDELDALLQRMLSLPVNQPEPDLPPPPPPMPAPPINLPPPPAMPQLRTPPPMPPAPPMPSGPPMPQAKPSVASPAPFRQPAPGWSPPIAPAEPPAPPQPRRAGPPTGDHAWNIPLPAGAGASFHGWPSGIETLTTQATSTVVPRPSPAPPPNRLNVATVPSPDEANRLREAPPPIPRARFDPASFATPPASPQPLMAPFAEPPLPFYMWPLSLFDRAIGATLGSFGLPGRWLGQGGGKTLCGWCGLLMVVAAICWGVVDYMGLWW